MHQSKKSFPFLDITIMIEGDVNTNTTLYRKKTVGNTLLDASSFYSIPLINSIPYGQYLRLCRICSSDILFKQEAYALRMRLSDRGYTKTALKKAYKRASRQTRQEALCKRP